MQQPERVVSYSAGAAAAMRSGWHETHPVWYYGLLFGALSGLFAVLQLAVSVTSAVENQAAYASLFYGMRNQALDPVVLLRWLGPVLVATYTSCLLGFALSMWLCWHAGRAATATSGRASTGALAGMVASMICSVIWIVASVVAVALFRTDGSISGILTANAAGAKASTGGEIAGLALQEAVAALIALGFAAVAGRMGGGAAPARTIANTPVYGQPPAPTTPGMAYYGGFVGGFAAPPPFSGAPFMMPPPGRPFVLAPMYPPPPAFYEAQQQGASYVYPRMPQYPASESLQPPTPYPGYPPPQWTPPSPSAPPPQAPANAEHAPATPPPDDPAAHE